MEEPRMGTRARRECPLRHAPLSRQDLETPLAKPLLPASNVSGIPHSFPAVLHQEGAKPEMDVPTSVFDQIINLLHKERSPKEEEARPFPIVLGDGRHVDLFRLYVTVRDRGGYHAVTASGSWDLVAKEVGLDPAVRSALKLIYAKYLVVFDRWLQEVLAKRAGEEDERASFHGPTAQKAQGGELWEPLENRVTQQRASLDECGVVVGLDPVCGGARFLSLKGKWSSLVDMVEWVRKVAKSPRHLPFRNMGAVQSGHACCEDGELFSRALLARDAIFLNVFRASESDGSPRQKRQKFFLSINDQDTNSYSQANEVVTCSQMSWSHSYSNKSNVIDYDSDENFIKSGAECSNDEQCLMDCSISHVTGLYAKEWKSIRVGPAYQASVPEWIGNVSVTSIDSNFQKYLGTQIWLPLINNNTLLIKQQPIGVGKGRGVTCFCEYQGSIECVRLHVVEKRVLLKHELGTAFHALGFEHMGEEVSLFWKEEDEERFKAAVHLNPPSLGRSFWDWVFMSFPTRSRQGLVSYYFNVFILRRRSHQNRVTPNETDSDDDESEFGLSKCFWPLCT